MANIHEISKKALSKLEKENLPILPSNYFVEFKNQAQIAKEQKEGFVTNKFIKPNSSDKNSYSKISYIKLFEPFDWHIGTGEYIDELTKNNQEEIINWLDTLKYENSSFRRLRIESR